MPVRVLPDFLINQIAAGEVVERPASVVKELIENALDAGADQIVIDVVDGGRTLISVIDNGAGISAADLPRVVMRHATSKLPTDDLLNINYMGFRGEALPSIASVSDMTIDSMARGASHGWRLDVSTGDVRPSDWDAGTRVRVENLFSRTPARLKFLRGDRAEMMSVLEVVKRLAMARPDVGFALNNKWFFGKNQDLSARIASVMGDDVVGRMLGVDATSGTNGDMKLSGFISQPTLRRASSVDQYLFVNGRPVKDKVLVGALRAAYMDVMHAREFPLCALYLTLNPRNVDVNVSPAKTEVHFLEPSHVRAFIIKSLRDALARTVNETVNENVAQSHPAPVWSGVQMNLRTMPKMEQTQPKTNTNFSSRLFVASPHRAPDTAFMGAPAAAPNTDDIAENLPLGRVIGQIANKYILAQSGDNLVIIDQHAAHERITYEKLRTHAIKTQPLLTPIVVKLRAEEVAAVLTVSDELRACSIDIDAFGDDAIAISAVPSDWNLDWADAFHAIADEVRANGHSSAIQERLHLKLANFACHHSVRAGQKLDMNQMNALLRDIENTPRAGECNHGRPVYKIIPIVEIDGWFERV